MAGKDEANEPDLKTSDTDRNGSLLPSRNPRATHAIRSRSILLNETLLFYASLRPPAESGNVVIAL